MATDKPRFSVTFSDESFDKIQKYKKENNISTQSKAVARLVEIAINEIESEGEIEKSPSIAEAVPGEGRISIEDSNRLLIALGLIQEGQDLSDDDFSFLSNIVGLLNTWFGKR